MVELQSCATLVNASALCAIEQEVQGDGTNAIAEISAELQRERQKNAELMERISMLEAQILERDKDHLLIHGRGNFSNATERNFKMFKKRRIEPGSDTTEEGNAIKSIEMAHQVNHDTECSPPNNMNPEDLLVNWMSMDENQFLNLEKVKDGDSAADFDDTDDSDDEDDDYCEEDDIDIDHKYGEYDNSSKAPNRPKKHLHEGVINEGIHTACLGESTFAGAGQETNEDGKKDYLLLVSKHINNSREQRRSDMKETKKIGGCNTPSKAFTFEQEACHKASGSIPFHKRPPKLAFCPKEIKRIIDSEALMLKNAQSHTMRKIIVFASLGIRHGCDDMYELDFNHFIILRKGEPYVSPKNPGEHILYDKPGVRRKVFYPNRQNPILCPVKILEEEKAMRPSDASCPSCLFLCIKYGGRTRNLPQNEYVRQRMGRNKLKSFGPVMCQMAMLVHIRSGSFFFKALGITLLFMAGFPNDMVQRETKYRNLDLLQKYYRTDEDTKGEDLFLSHAVTCDTVSPDSKQLTGKVIPSKSKAKKLTNSTGKLHSLQKPLILQNDPSTSTPVTQFGLMGYTSIHTRAITSLQSMASHTPGDTLLTSNPVVTSSGPDVPFHNQTSYPVFPSQPANAFMPMLYWPPPNTFPPCPYPASYGYQSFPSTGSFMSVHPQPYYSQPSCNLFIPKVVEDNRKNDAASEEADSDSDSNSSAEPKETLASCKS